MSVSVLMVRILLEECRARRLEADSLLAGTPLTLAQLSDSRQQLSSDAFGALALRALELTRDEGLGLVLGARLPSQALQLIGFLLSSAPTLRHAIQDVQRYGALLATHPRWELHEQAESGHIEFRCPIFNPRAARMANEWSLSFAYRVIGAYAPAAGNRRALAVAFAHPRPKHASAYERVFDCRVVFGARRNILSVPRVWLDSPQPHGDHVTWTRLHDLAEQLLSNVSFKQRLSERLRSMLREERELSQLDVSRLARRAGLSQSALRRRLAAEGVSPLQLLDEARCRLACAKLASVDTPIKQVANQLGYAEPRSFQRAFKRWTGKTPASYRADSDSAEIL